MGRSLTLKSRQNGARTVRNRTATATMVKETKVKRMRKRERMGEGAGRGRRERVIWSENERRERAGQI